jgi:hypothetical protein
MLERKKETVNCSDTTPIVMTGSPLKTYAFTAGTHLRVTVYDNTLVVEGFPNKSRTFFDRENPETYSIMISLLHRQLPQVFMRRIPHGNLWSVTVTMVPGMFVENYSVSIMALVDPHTPLPDSP